MKNFILLSFVISLLLSSSASAIEINDGPKAPLYWSAYEYCYTVSNNGMLGYIPEDVWESNINWVEQNLKSYGYDMVCIDGWGDDSNFNENGYRTKHSTHWEHDYAWR